MSIKMEIRSLRFQEREIERKRLRYKEKYLNTVHRDGNFAPPRLTRPSPLRPVRVFPAPQR